MQDIKIPSLYEYIRAEFEFNKKKTFKENKHYKVLCNALEDVLLGRKKDLIINIPPRIGKSEIVCKQFISWGLSIYPDSNFIYTSYSIALAREHSEATRDIVQSSFYNSMFPHVALKKDSKTKNHWKTTAGGAFYASGTTGSITGFGAGTTRDGFGGAFIIDDPLKADEAHSQVKREAVIRWFQNTVGSRLNKPETPIIIIMQRLHEEDLVGWLLEGNDGREWDHINIPALSPEGKPEFPHIYPMEVLKREEKNNPYNFASQFLQSPTVYGGAIFKKEWWRYYKTDVFRLDWGIITVDTAQKKGEHNDYTVFQCWGYIKGGAYLIDHRRFKAECPDLKMLLWNFYRGVKDKVHIRRVLIEDKVSGTGLIQEIDRDRDIPIPIEAVPRIKDKVTRAYDVAGYVSAGLVFLPEDMVQKDEFLNEFTSFTPTMTHRHDDQVDATCDALMYIFTHAGKGKLIQ